MAICVKVVKTEMIIVNKYHMPLLKSNSRNFREIEENQGKSGELENIGETRENPEKPG